MKNVWLSVLFIFSGFGLFGQQLFFETYSGYNLSNYDLEAYNTSVGSVPLGFKIAGGHQNVQLGFDYRFNLSNPEFDIINQTLEYRHSFDESYYGLFLRGNISSLPAYRFGLIVSAGAGYYTSTYELTPINDNLPSIESYDYKKEPGYNFYVGVSAPIYAQLHWEIGYQYNSYDRPSVESPLIAAHHAGYHSIHVGLSGNFVFGKTKAKCRRIMSMKSSGSKKRR